MLAPFVIHRLKVTPYGAWPAIGSRSCPRFSDIIDEFPSLNRHDYIFHNVNDNLNANPRDVFVIVFVIVVFYFKEHSSKSECLPRGAYFFAFANANIGSFLQ